MVNNPLQVPLDPMVQRLVGSVQNRLGIAVAQGYVSAASKDDAYELYILSLLVEAALQEGSAPPRYLDRDGRPTTSPLFRRGPGELHVESPLYTHVVLRFPDKPPLEVHLGVMVAGKTPAVISHEFDIAVIPADEADRCRRPDQPDRRRAAQATRRRSRKHPQSSKVMLMVECKFYPGRSAGLGLARAFRGLVADISTEDCFFVSTQISSEAETFIGKFSRQIGNGVLPPSNAALVSRLKDKFRSVFEQYKRMS